MEQKRYTTEQIIRILRQADSGQTIESICREHNISQGSFYRWKKKYGDQDAFYRARVNTELDDAYQ